MNCAKPFMLNGSAFGCGQCTPCRINRRRIWAHRIILESYQHEANSFVTLTFSDPQLPIDLSVSPRTVSLFIKRLRKMLDHPVRYFAVGEYGDQTGRPHYHLALFGYPQCLRGRTDLRRQVCCEVCSTIARAWTNPQTREPYGAIEVAPLEPGSAEYVAGYTVKKWTRDDDPRLEGRLPEFARMSLRPAIGLFAMHDVASALMGLDQLNERYIDVPLALSHGTKKLPLGRFLRRKLRTFIGRAETTPPAILEAQKLELSPMLEAAKANTPKSLHRVPGLLQTATQTEIINAGEGRRIQLEARQHRNRKKRI